MSSKEQIAFSSQIITSITMYVNRVSVQLRNKYGLTYSSFLALLVMKESSQKMKIVQLADFLCIAQGTAIKLLLALEDSGLVDKSIDSADGRIALCSLSDEGERLVDNAVSEISEKLKEDIFLSLPLDELPALQERAKSAYNALRGHSVPGLENVGESDRYLADFLGSWRALITKIACEVRSAANLSLNEYRIVKSLFESGSTSAGYIADILSIELSGVSIYKDKLLKKGLIEEAQDPFDMRKRLVRCTMQGNRAVLSADAAVASVFRTWSDVYSDDEIISLNAWGMRMYGNIRRAELQNNMHQYK